MEPSCHHNQSITITKLNVDCLEELYEWLSRRDLLSLRRTCKRIKQTVDYYIRTNYAAVGKMEINDSNVKEIKEFCKKATNPIELINEIKINTKSIDLAKFNELFTKIERIKLINSKTTGEFNKVFLQFCLNLKFLQINLCGTGNVIIGIGNEWLQRQHPKLEHVCFKDNDEMRQPINELKTFFELNKNIHSFTTNYCFLKTQGNFLSSAGIKFDHLHIHAINHPVFEHLTVDVDLLKKLHSNGFYKHVSLYGGSLEDENNAIATNLANDLALIPGLLKISMSFSPFVFPAMANLKALSYTNSGSGELYGIEHLLRNVIMNIEELYVDNCCVSYIVPLIQSCPKLKVIRFHDDDEGRYDTFFDNYTGNYDTYFDGLVIDLNVLDKLRAKLKGACKLTIYVRQTLFLERKWARIKTSYRLIQLKPVQEHNEYTPQWD